MDSVPRLHGSDRFLLTRQSYVGTKENEHEDRYVVVCCGNLFVRQRDLCQEPEEHLPTGQNS